VFKSQFSNVLFTKCLEKSGKTSNFVLEKSGKPQLDFCTNPGYCLAVHFTGWGHVFETSPVHQEYCLETRSWSWETSQGDFFGLDCEAVVQWRI